MSYPCWLYSAEGAKIVKTREEELALVGKWYDTPAKIGMIEEVQEDLLGLTESQESAIEDKPKRGRPAKQ
jgi:hypothetical protein